MATTSELRSPLSLMDDIMDELAGTTPDTPQPSHSSDLSDFGLAFELSRQLDINASEAKTSTGRPGNGVQKIVGKLEQNRAFKDNAFLQQARSGAGVGGGLMPPTPPVSGGAPNRSTFNNGSTAYRNQQSTTTTTTAAATGTTTTNANASSYLASRFRTTKEAEEEEKAQAAAAKLREASRKANAQLPSDDEGSDVSSEEDSDDEQRGFKKQQRLLAQQQHQHQLFLQQQAILQNELAGVKGGEMGDGEVEVKPVVINHEAVIDRMKGRHRALLQGAHHAAREEDYEDYRDEYAMQQQGMMSPGGSSGGAAMAYGMQYGSMDPSMMYADEYRLQQQQQQQLYYPQGGIPGHPHANAAYSHPSVMNGMVPGYGYAHPPATMPSYASGMQMPTYHHNQYFQGGGGRGTPTPVMSHHIIQQQQFQQGGRSNSVVSDGSSLPNSSRRGSVQHSVVSSARVSEDSWNEASQQLQQQHHHHQLQHSMSALSTQKTADSDSGYSGVASDQGKHTSFDDSLEDIQTAVGSEYEKSSSTGTKSKVDDVAKMIDVLSISQAAAAGKDSDGDDEDDQSSDDEKSEGSDSDSEQDEDPESLKGSTMIDSIRYSHRAFKGGITTGSSSSPSAATSNNGSNEHENDNDIDSSDDDDQPIILSRRNSARGTFLPAAAAAASAGIRISAEEAVVMSGPQVMQQVPVPTSNGQMQYMSAMNMYQQQPMHMSYMPPQQQQSQPQQQAYIPMGYQFPGPQPGPMVSHHQHSYSVDRAMSPPSMVAQGPVARRVNPASASKGHTSTGSSGSAIQSQYPIPATTLLHPGSRRSQSVRARPQATNPINSNTNPAAAQGNGQAGRGRSSIDFVRLPNNGYQSMISGPINGPDFASSGNGTGPYIRGYTEPLSSPPLQSQQPQQQALPPHPQQHHQQMQHQLGKQQLQQGYFMSGPMPSQYGYMMQTGVGVGVGGDPYSSHPHQQQILQAGRR
ncbi:hypothetical protein EC957_008513 [Mortierella hygrophila]|uniref:Uncharacterized protein n=1 Tax=Mortierella hygrophila TaxID=979708 RepID=A0A9P6EXQ4_9FUNG|nr:hypothetical protein EC957_008513 [Mortierella hygrophila]